MQTSKIVIASDHAGLELKEELKVLLTEMGCQVSDLGPSSSERVDYPDYAESVSVRVSRKEADLGVLICGTGLGMSITANKIPGIRAAILYDAIAAKYARLHNDANVIIFGGRTMKVEEAKEYLKIFLAEEFEGGRHTGRIRKIIEVESRNRSNNGGK